MPKFIVDSQFKAIIHFKQGPYTETGLVRYSRDWTNEDGNRINQWLGFVRLLSMLNRWGAKVKYAYIYANIPNGEPLIKFSGGLISWENSTRTAEIRQNSYTPRTGDHGKPGNSYDQAVLLAMDAEDSLEQLLQDLQI